MRQQAIDNDPDAVTLYTFEINIDTLEVEVNEYKELDYDEDGTGYARYEESLKGNHIYAESLLSTDHARELVYNFCCRFAKCVGILFDDVLKSRDQSNLQEFG